MCAPSGGNSHTARYLVITDPDVLTRFRVLTKAAFAAMEVTPTTYSSLAASIMRSKTGAYVYDYGAPVLIVLCDKADYGNNMADCACAAENMFLAANALDLGSCYINQLHWLRDDPAIRDYLISLGMAEDETVCLSLAIGYVDSRDGLPARNERQ